MFYDNLVPSLNKSQFFNDFDAEITLANQTVQYTQLNRSAKSLLLARAFKQTKKNILFITADDKLAEDYLDDLHILVSAQAAAFLPDLEVLPYEERSPHYTIRAQRVECLAAAVNYEPRIFCVSIRSFLRKIVTREVFAKNIISLTRGEDYNPDILVSNLVGMGYTSVPQVSRVGEFARRGGIIDIYSPHSSRPVRAEFFGDEVESLRSFNVVSQRSTQGEHQEIIFLPSREFSLHNIDTDARMWEKIHTHGFYEGIESDASLVLAQTKSFISYFTPADTIVFWDEFQHFKSEIDELEEETHDLYTKAKAAERHVAEPSEIFANRQDVYKWLKKYPCYFLATGHQNLRQSKLTVEAPFASQTVMHSDLGVLEQSLSEKIAAGYRIIIQSDNKSQSKRMKDLLPDFIDKLSFSLGVLQKGFTLHDAKLAVFTDHEIFSRYKRRKSAAKFSKDQALVDYDALTPGDYVVHITHGIGVFEGLEYLQFGPSKIECLAIRYAGADRVFVPTHHLHLLTKFISDEGYAPTLHKLGGKRWEQQKRSAKSQIELVASDLVDLYAARKLRKGISFEPDNQWQMELEDSFLYEDTPDQATSTREIKDDMESDTPMERLLCGDVGFGKTEVAIRAAFKAVLSGYQVAILVPTTLLAEQHFFVFRERLAQYPVSIAMFSRFRSKANIQKDLTRVNRGEVDIAIGTHRLLSKDVTFPKLGLLVIDEEHRFGVRHKDQLRKLKENVDTLYMSATPIPRTMSMALSKLKEMSLIRTSPKARLPIRTVVIPYDEEVIKDAIKREVDRGGQVFFIHNRVQTINSVERELKQLLPSVRFRVGHGQLPEKQLEAVMMDFSNHQYDVLVASTIIETGIDIANANTIIINNANMFGLAQLYQMRGRVGRSSRRAYAYLIVPGKLADLPRKRLETLTEYNSLGAGYQIAMRDLELRGAGTMLGTKQSGVINSIGFNYYNRLLEEAVTNLQEKNPAGMWEEVEVKPKNITIESDFYLPSDYITNEKIRLGMYKRMLAFTSGNEFSDLKLELVDRFGKLPEPALQAINYYQIQTIAEQVGLVSFKLRNGLAMLEFDQKSLPKREYIGKLVQRFTYPVAFDSSANLKIKFTLSPPSARDKQKELDSALAILSFIEKEFI